MKSIKNLEEFITEKKVAVKRRYTESHPAKFVSTAARVRNAVLDAIGDGVITEDEMNKILSEIQAHKRWVSRNSKLFNITEEDGVKKISISSRGKRIRTLTRELNESLLLEGQFSWLTHDGQIQIGSDPTNKVVTYMFDDKGNKWEERDYEGYGEFGGMDYYELVATMNGYTEADLADKKLMKSARVIGKPELRQLGIALAFDKLKPKNGKKVLFPALVTDPRYNWKRHDFTKEAESDPDQGWDTTDYSDEDDYFESAITEALRVPHKEPGKKPVNIFVGRFQPFTLGHVKVFEKMYKENGLPTVVFLVRSGKPDPEKKPFNEDLQQAMFAAMTKQYPFLEASYVIPNGGIDTIFANARPAYEPMLWGFGTDRKKAYNYQIEKPEYREQLGVNPDFKGYEIFRTDDNISASKVRQALKTDDEGTFKKMTPKSIHKFYKTLQNELQPIQENNNHNMKNIKSLNEFINENIISEKKEYGLYVYPTTQADFKKLEKWLKDSDYYAEVDSNRGYVFFPEEKENHDSLETELDKEFNKAKISARFEGESNESVNEEYIELPSLDDPASKLIKAYQQWYKDTKMNWSEYKNDMAEDSVDEAAMNAQMEILAYLSNEMNKVIKDNKFKVKMDLK